MMDSLNIISWNVRGLGGRHCCKVKSVFRRQLRKSLVGRIDVLLIQEHHLNEQRIQKYGNLLPGQWRQFWVPATGDNNRKAGLGIAINDFWCSAFLHYGVLTCGRGQYVILQIGLKKWGLLNIYAPNHTKDRTILWKSLMAQLPVVDHWALAGDFNMLEDGCDRLGGTSQTISGLELYEWERLIFSLGLLDLWHVSSFTRIQDSLEYSRSDRRQSHANLSRLDRFYADKFLWDKGGSIGIIPSFSFSDHAPLRLVIVLQEQYKNSRFRIPNHVFLSPDCSPTVHNIWNKYDYSYDYALSSVHKAISETQQFFYRKAKQVFYASLTKIGRLRRGLKSLQHLQERRPHSSYISARVVQVGNQILDLQKISVDFNYHNTSSTWAESGDKVNKLFFAVHNHHKSSARISRLRCPDGSYTTDPSQMRQIASDYYEALLKARPFSEADMVKRDIIWSRVQNRVSGNLLRCLLQPLSTQEVFKAVKALAKDVCPGVDGLGVQWYIQYWDLIGDGLTKAYQQILDSGNMPQEWKEGLIYMIPKTSGQLEELSQWRPITLLNVIYKILAKTIARRLQPYLSELIHDTQTGFLQERSIFDNIILFWEMVTIAEVQKQDLAVLFLDFEKAYDRVDWDFMEGTLVRMGFPSNWIRGVSALYRNASSSLLFAGDIGRRFFISRSVRQGCPLAPFLFLLVSEAFSVHLNSPYVNIKGLALPVANANVDCEFADDTALYVQASHGNLFHVQKAVDDFSDASGALINWDKSSGFWVASGDPPVNVPSLGFTWIPQGQSIRYLGCRVGVGLKSEDMIAPLLLRLRNKLVYWNKEKLSLAGRVVVANAVLLSSIWYIASTWLFSRSIMLKVQRLVRNFIWGNNRSVNPVAKVAWSILIQPKQKGGLGLIDPFMQSKALLTKHVVRSLLPGQELWKKLWMQHLYKVKPSVGGQWKDSLRWFFNADFQLPKSNDGSLRFFNGIFRAWETLRQALVFLPPKSYHQFMRQPLIWNPLFTDEAACVLGLRPRLSWAAMDSGPARTVADWIRFMQSSTLEQSNRLSNLRGAKIMLSQLSRVYQVTVPTLQFDHFQSWYGMFSTLNILIGARLYDQNGSIYFYEVLDNGRLILVDEESQIMLAAKQLPVRVIARLDKNIYIDPSPLIVNFSSHISVLDSKPIDDLQWDPADYGWKLSISDSSTKILPFFKYSVAFGRNFMLRQTEPIPAGKKYWEEGNVSSTHMVMFWKQFWSIKCMNKILHFRWLMIHYALPIGHLLRGSVSNRSCIMCGFADETLHHAFWECVSAKSFWCRILRLLGRKYRSAIFTWGAVFWGMLDQQRAFYHYNHSSLSLYVRSFQVYSTSRSLQGVKFFSRSYVWQIVSSLSLWVLWKARCSKLYNDEDIHVVDQVKSFWNLLVHSVKGEYDRYKGYGNTAIRKRKRLRRVWSAIPIMLDAGTEVRWNYVPPRWLFPPPVPFLWRTT